MGAYAFLFWSNVRSDANSDDRLNPALSMHRANPSAPAMARQTLPYTQLGLATPARRKELARLTVLGPAPFREPQARTLADTATQEAAEPLPVAAIDAKGWQSFWH